jgi:hypothetical protein
MAVIQHAHGQTLLDARQWHRGCRSLDFRRTRAPSCARRMARQLQGSDAMSEKLATNVAETIEDDELGERIPAMQQLLDNPFLLLFIGVAMPTVLYVIWGVMEIVGIPIAK